MLKKKVSFILPAYNEQDNVRNLYFHLGQILDHYSYDYELIFINDGSTDATLSEIMKIARFDQSVKYISFSRNFGKESAIYAGLEHATGDAVIIMDSDLQHPPQLIGELLKGYEQGYHQVIACRNRQGESAMYKFFTGTFYSMMNRISDVELKNGEGDFRLLSRKAVNALMQLSESNRFSKGLYAWIGLAQKTIYYENVQRENGKSKWSLSALITYALDGVLSFNMKPLRLCLYLGIIIILAGLSYVGVMFTTILLKGIDVPGYFTLISSVLILGGVQILCLGIMGEYIGRIYNESKKRPHYIVEESNVSDYLKRSYPVLKKNKSKVAHIQIVKEEAR